MKILTGEQKQVFKKAKKFSRGLYKNNFPELFSNGKDRLEIPITNINYKDSKSFKLVDSYLKENNYQIKDYLAGYAVKEGDKNIYKIGKIIRNNTYISNNFRDCVYRQKFKLVVSRHPYDIACASWDQDWESCLHFESGFNCSNIHDMVIANSCMIAYLVSATKNTVLGRCFVIPYYNYHTGDYWLYTSNTPYGLFPKEVLIFLRKWLDKNYNEKYLLPKLNSDDIVVKFEFPNDLVYDNDDIQSIKLFNMKNINKYTIRKKINNNEIEKMLKDCYKLNGEYFGLNLILEETKKWYDYHKSYGRDENCRDMKRNRFLLYWLEEKEPNYNEIEDYFNYLSRFNLLINNGSRKIEKIIENDYNYSNDKLKKYLKIIKNKIKWEEGKQEFLSLNKNSQSNITQKRLLSKFV